VRSKHSCDKPLASAWRGDGERDDVVMPMNLPGGLAVTRLAWNGGSVALEKS